MAKQAAYFVVLVILLSIAFVLFERSASPVFQECVSDYEKSRKSQPPKEQQPTDEIFIGAYVLCIGTFTDRHGGGITALATIIIAAFTVILWVTSYRQWSVSNRTLLLQFRPKLIVRNVVVKRLVNEMPPKPLFQQNMPVIGHFYISNIGGTPAMIIEVGCWVECSKRLPMRRPYEGKDANTVPYLKVLGPSESTPCDFDSVSDKGKVMDSNATMILGGDFGWALYVMGWVQYTDKSNARHRTAFCRKYDISKERFMPVDDSDYEHAE